MKPLADTGASMQPFLAHLKNTMAAQPSAGGVAVTQAPAVLDVMGGIGEDSGSLVLTAPLALSCKVAAWPLTDQRIRVRVLS
jgi:hypothetical protein